MLRLKALQPAARPISVTNVPDRTISLLGKMTALYRKHCNCNEITIQIQYKYFIKHKTLYNVSSQTTRHTVKTSTILG